MKAAFYTLGCKLNYSETATIISGFKKRRFDIVDFDESADLYYINTCAVTEIAEKECAQVIRRALRKNPYAYIIVAGCFAQLQPEKIAFIKGVDLILGNNEKFDFFSFEREFKKHQLARIYVVNSECFNAAHISHSSEESGRTRAFLKIQDGCDYKCSYCTIPLARGKNRSVCEDEIENSFIKLLSNEYKEIVLTGVNVGEYSSNNCKDLLSLLRRLTNIKGDFRIRISSIEPNLVTEDILEFIADSPKICDHLHIPLQSGSSNILKLMKRRYNADFYKNIIDKVFKILPNVGIGLDIIVGFPGETQKDFEDTYKFIEGLPIEYLHAFSYSERPNTEAIRMNNKVDIIEKKDRVNRLRKLGELKKEKFYNSMIGKKNKVLFEKGKDNGKFLGFSSNYVRVELESELDIGNNFFDIEIVGANRNICYGKIIK